MNNRKLNSYYKNVPKEKHQLFQDFLNNHPNSEVHVFDEGGGYHMIFLFPEKYTQVLSQYLE